MKILLVAASYAPNVGGLQRVCATLAEELQRRNHDVTVLTQRYPRNLPSKETVSGVNVRRLLFLIPRWQMLYGGRLVIFLASLWYLPATLCRVLWLVGRERPAVVNIHFLGAPTLFLLIARLFFRFCLVVTLHGDDVEGLERGTGFDRWLFRTSLRNADAVTACSRYLLEQAEQLEPAIADKAHTIYNGAAPDVILSREVKERERQDRFLLLGVGRMVAKKGFDLLVNATALTGPATQLVLVGDGPERQKLAALVRKLNMERRVAFRGALSSEEVINEMAASRIVVIPSRHEPFGIVALEAMAAGKPIVAARVGGLPEVLADADAILIDPDNAKALALAITETFQKITLEPTFGQRNRNLAAQFSLERMTEGYLKVYEAAMKH